MPSFHSYVIKPVQPLFYRIFFPVALFSASETKFRGPYLHPLRWMMQASLVERFTYFRTHSKLAELSVNIDTNVHRSGPWYRPCSNVARQAAGQVSPLSSIFLSFFFTFWFYFFLFLSFFLSTSFHPSFLLPFFLQTSTCYDCSADHLRPFSPGVRKSKTGRHTRADTAERTELESSLYTAFRNFVANRIIGILSQQTLYFFVICCPFFQFCRSVYISFLVHPSLQQVGRQTEKPLQCNKPRS